MGMTKPCPNVYIPHSGLYVYIHPAWTDRGQLESWKEGREFESLNPFRNPLPIHSLDRWDWVMRTVQGEVLKCVRRSLRTEHKLAMPVIG